MCHQAEDSYGKIPAAEYAKMMAEANEEHEPEETMREDYEIGVDELGEFEAYYRCSCERCGFEFRFTHKEDAKVDPNGTGDSKVVKPTAKLRKQRW